MIKAFLIFASGLFLLLAGCASRSEPGQAAQDYLAFTEQNPGANLRGKTERQAISNVKDYLGHLTKENILTQTKKVYAADAFFNDTLKTVRGSAAIEEYFLGTVANTEEIRVTFTDVARSGNEYYFRWVMDVKFKQFQRNKTIRTIGMTHVRFNSQGQVILHQDYWDSAQGLFEYIPVLGGGIRLIKSRL